MSDFFVDHQNTALYPSAYMSVPASAASLPQDGDGTVTGLDAPPAVSSASWDCTGVSATAATLTIMGATVTGITGAAGAATASAAATAINASTAAVTTANGNITNVYLKAMVWATASGATLNVYSRIASAALNYSNNPACAMAAGSGWSSPPAMAQFSGGVSGPFAYLFNVATLAAAVSATVGTTVGLYGAMASTTMGQFAAGDKVHIRTKRGGSNVTVTLPDVSMTVTTRAIGTYEAPLFFIADYGVKWPTETGQLVVSMNGAAAINRSVLMPTNTGIKQVWLGTRIDDVSCSWKWQVTGVPVNSSYTFKFGNSGAANNQCHLEGMEVGGLSVAYSGGPADAIDNTNSTHNYIQIAVPNHSAFPTETSAGLCKDIIFKTKGKASLFAAAGAGNHDLELIDCKFDHRGVTQATDEAMFKTGGGSSTYKFFAKNCKWIGFISGLNQSGFQKSTTSGFAQVTLLDCSLENILISGGGSTGGFLGITETTTGNAHVTKSITVLSSLGIRPFVFENSRRSVVWIDSAAPKTSASLLPDGTQFSLRYGVTSQVGNISALRPVFFPRLGKHNSLSSGNRTARLRFLVDNNILAQLSGGPRAPKNDEIWASVTYVKMDGTLGVVTTHPGWSGIPASLSAGVAGDWSAVSYDFNGVPHNYTPYEISLALPNVKTLTELGLVLGMACQSNSVENILFVDPEWSLT